MGREVDEYVQPAEIYLLKKRSWEGVEYIEESYEAKEDADAAALELVQGKLTTNIYGTTFAEAGWKTVAVVPLRLHLRKDTPCDPTASLTETGTA